MAPIYIMIDQKETGRNILDLMHRQGLKVRDIQEACGFEQPQAVYKWLHGQSLPSIDNLLILAKLFESTVEGILAISGDALPHFSTIGRQPWKKSIFTGLTTSLSITICICLLIQPSIWRTRYSSSTSFGSDLKVTIKRKGRDTR